MDLDAVETGLLGTPRADGEALHLLRDLNADLGAEGALPRTPDDLAELADADAIAPAGWALAHGMAYLHIDGTLAAGSPQEVACRVREAFTAIVGASAASSASGSRTSPE